MAISSRGLGPSRRRISACTRWASRVVSRITAASLPSCFASPSGLPAKPRGDSRRW
jgi:hypothetical protein